MEAPLTVVPHDAGPPGLLAAPWLVGAIAGAPLLLGLLPLVAPHWPAWLVAVFLLQPLYMLHQVEEHAYDRFRRHVNAGMAGGLDALSTEAVAVINVGGVWAVNAVALLLAGLVHPGFGLVSAWVVLVNAAAHLGQAVARRETNPGLWTAILLFLPGGGAALALVGAQPGVGWVAQAGGLGAAVLLHAAIILHLRRRIAALRPKGG